jgi:hypothetical protein
MISVLQMNHHLPLKHHLAHNMLLTAMFFAYGLPHELAAVELYGLQGWAQSACRGISRLLIITPPDVMTTQSASTGEMLCTEQRSARLVLALAYFAIAAALPTAALYLHESTAKHAFLADQVATRSVHDKGTRGWPAAWLSPVAVAYTWAGSALCWGLLCIWCITVNG